MPWRRFIAHKIDERKYLIVDTETGLEATVDGQTFGLMGEIQAHFGVGNHELAGENASAAVGTLG